MAKPIQAAPNQAVFLKQRHTFFGDTELTFTEKAIRLENVGRWRFVLVSRAPQWQIDVFRNDDRTYYSESLKTLEETGLVSNFVLGFRPRYPEDIVRKPREFQFHNMPALRSATPYSSYEYLKLGACAPEIERILLAAYKTPTCGGIPINASSRGYGKDWMTGAPENGEMRSRLKTLEFAIKPVGSELFELPKGYKKAPSLREVVSGTDSRKESEDMQTLFGR